MATFFVGRQEPNQSECPRHGNADCASRHGPSGGDDGNGRGCREAARGEVLEPRDQRGRGRHPAPRQGDLGHGHDAGAPGRRQEAGEARPQPGGHQPGQRRAPRAVHEAVPLLRRRRLRQRHHLRVLPPPALEAAGAPRQEEPRAAQGDAAGRVRGPGAADTPGQGGRDEPGIRHDESGEQHWGLYRSRIFARGEEGPDEGEAGPSHRFEGHESPVPADDAQPELGSCSDASAEPRDRRGLAAPAPAQPPPDSRGQPLFAGAVPRHPGADADAGPGHRQPAGQVHAGPGPDPGAEVPGLAVLTRRFTLPGAGDG
mmetsp:Transcript_101546/g.219242  ORF Transcript_101546/g.219242 Transcript_101546/m.219242 type:complete len:314 (-) Transcript_101546:96-1037(-)